MDSEPKSLLRLRYLLSRYGRVFVVALLLVSSVAFVSAALAYTTTPETRQVTEQTDVQSFKTTVNTSATVTGETSLYETGRTLSNMPVYLINASPNVTVIAHTEVPDDRVVNVSQQITIELSATRNGEVFWSETRTLASDTEQVTDGTLVTAATVDVGEIRRGRLSEVQSETESVGVLQTAIHADTVYKAQTYEGSLAITAPVEMTDRSYTIDAPQSDERSHATPVTRTVGGSEEGSTTGTPVTQATTVQAGLLTGLEFATPSTDSVVRGGLGLLALAAAFVVRRVYRRLPDQEETEQAYDKVRFSDWISRGKIPESDAYERIPIEEFVDLVDIAIDSDKRVIHDQDRGLRAVIDDSIIYYHTAAGDQSNDGEHPDDGEYPSDPQPEPRDEDGDNPEDASSSLARMSDGGTRSEKVDPPSAPSRVVEEDPNHRLGLMSAYSTTAILWVVGLTALLIGGYRCAKSLIRSQ